MLSDKLYSGLLSFHNFKLQKHQPCKPIRK